MGKKGSLKHVTKEMLEELYWGQKLSTTQITQVLPLTLGQVQWLMKKYDIPRRTKAEALKGHKGWAKGLTKETHPGIASTALKISGEGNPNFGKRGPASYWYGRHHSEETKEKMSQSLKGLNIGRHPTEETRHKLSKATTGERNPNYGKKPSEVQRANLSEKISALWQNPQYVAHMMQLRRTKPNKQEQKLIKLLAEQLPEFRYNGDFSQGVMLGGLIPDFINADGAKEVIELYGDYWHSKDGTRWRQTELGRIMSYNSIGYRCLVIWQSELKDTDKVVEKIQAFTSLRRR